MHDITPKQQQQLKEFAALWKAAVGSSLEGELTGFVQHEGWDQFVRLCTIASLVDMMRNYPDLVAALVTPYVLSLAHTLRRYGLSDLTRLLGQ